MRSKSDRVRAVVALMLVAGSGCAGLRSAPSGASPTPPGAESAPGTPREHAAPSAIPPAPPLQPAAPAPSVAPRCPPSMVALPAGRFRMGGRPVVVGELCLDVTEVTVAAYERCVAAGACRQAHLTGEWPGLTPDLRADSGKLCNQGKAGRARHPVNCVTAEQATQFCAWRHARLPTEEEFVWAARGGERASRYPWGDVEPTGQACWAGHRSGPAAAPTGSTCPVGSRPAGDSPQGLKDLAGGVFEWLRAADGSAVARGGSFVDLLPQYLAAEGERWSPAPERSGAIGFRCAASR